MTEKSKRIERSELWEKIYKVVSQIPSKEVEGDAMDAPSAATKIEELINRNKGTTRAIQTPGYDPYHVACQNCGVNNKPLQMIPFRNDEHVVGLIMSCDDCRETLYGQRFDREFKFKEPTIKNQKP